MKFWQVKDEGVTYGSCCPRLNIGIVISLVAISRHIMHTIIQCKVTVGPVKEKKIRDPLVGLWILQTIIQCLDHVKRWCRILKSMKPASMSKRKFKEG